MATVPVCLYGHPLPPAVEFCPMCGLATGWRPRQRVSRRVWASMGVAAVIVLGVGQAIVVEQTAQAPKSASHVLYHTGPVVTPDCTVVGDSHCEELHEDCPLIVHPGLHCAALEQPGEYTPPDYDCHPNPASGHALSWAGWVAFKASGKAG